MKHRKVGRKLGRERNQRNALKRTLLGSLIMEEKITTTEAKAKEIRPLIDKIIGKVKSAKKDKKEVAMIRELKKTLSQKSVEKISGKFIEKFSSRNSGYSRIIKLPIRKGDSAKMAVIELVLDL